MLTRELAQAVVAELNSEFSGSDPLWARARLFDPRDLELLDFELVEHNGTYFLRAPVVERTSGRRGYFDTRIGEVDEAD